MVVGLGVGLRPVDPCVGTNGVVDLVDPDTVGTVTKWEPFERFNNAFIVFVINRIHYLIHLKCIGHFRANRKESLRRSSTIQENICSFSELHQRIWQKKYNRQVLGNIVR